MHIGGFLLPENTMPTFGEDENVTPVARAILATGGHRDSEAALALLAIHDALRHATVQYRGRVWVYVDYDIFFTALPFFDEDAVVAAIQRLKSYKLVDLRASTEEVEGFPYDPYTYTLATLTAKGRKAMEPRTWGHQFFGRRRARTEASA